MLLHFKTDSVLFVCLHILNYGHLFISVNPEQFQSLYYAGSSFDRLDFCFFFCLILEPINIFHSSYSAESTFPIRLSYHRNTHYNSLIDPDKPTIGVGLGLPGFKPRVSISYCLASKVEGYKLIVYWLNKTILLCILVYYMNSIVT